MNYLILPHILGTGSCRVDNICLHCLPDVKMFVNSNIFCDCIVCVSCFVSIICKVVGFYESGHCLKTMASLPWQYSNTVLSGILTLSSLVVRSTTHCRTFPVNWSLVTDFYLNSFKPNALEQTVTKSRHTAPGRSLLSPSVDGGRHVSLLPLSSTHIQTSNI